MRFKFDGFNRYDIPTLTLANPNFEELAIIKNPKNLQASIRFNAVSELSFYIDKTENTKHYFDYLVKKRLIHVDGFGWFAILNTEMTTTGRTPRKEINCVSYEAALASRMVDLDAGTYIFYNPASTTGTLLNELFSNTLTWKIGYVSPSLYGKARTFDMPDTDIYSFLTQDVAEAYECVFLFDNQDMIINAYTTDELVKDSSVMLRFDTIMKSIKINETKDEIVTALSIYGASDFSISHVNPLGTPTIYKLDYYEHMMTPALWQAIQVWQSRISTSIMTYAENLTSLKERNVELLRMKSDLAKMQAILDSGKQVRDVQTPYTLQPSSNSAVSSMSSWVNNTSMNELSTLITTANAYPAISFISPPAAIAGYVNGVATADRGISEALVNIWACERVIVTQQTNISTKEDQIANLRASMSDISTSLSIPNNFSLEQREELEKYIFGTDYTNEYCVITESMTYPEIQDIALDLMQQGKSILNRVSQPTYEFELEAINYLFDKKFEGFIQQTQLGYTVYAELSDGEWVSPILLEVNINWEKPDNFSMKFGNRFRLQSTDYTWADLDDSVSKVSSAVNSEFSKLVEPSRSGLINEVSDLLTNAWDAAKNAVIAGDNQSMVMDRYGLLGRETLIDANGNPTGFFSPEQVKMTKNLICFTDDNWQNVKTALGKISLGNGSYAYGLAAEVIIGTLVAGNNLAFTNESGSFRFDGNGATLTNAILKVVSTNGLSQILMDASNGFKIQTRSSTSQAFGDKFYVDTSGNLHMAGTITAASGTIGSWTINSDRLVNINQTVGMISATGSNVVFYAGSSAPTSAPFRVLANGQLVATGANISGTINATSGTFNNVTIGSGTIGGMEINANGFMYNGQQIIDRTGNLRLANFYITGSGTPTLGTSSSQMNFYLSGGNAMALTNEYVQINTGLQINGLSTQDNVTPLGYTGSRVVLTNRSSGGSTLNNISDRSSGVDISGEIWASLQSGTFTYNVGYGQESRRLVYGGSSIRYKKDIEEIPAETADKLMDLTPVFYGYKEESETRRTPNVGLIAEDVAIYCPELVGYRFTNDGKAIPETVRYDLLSVVLLKYIQKLNSRVKELERRLH